MSLSLRLIAALLFVGFGCLIVFVRRPWSAADRLRAVLFLVSLGLFAVTIAGVSPSRVVAFLAAAPMPQAMAVLILNAGLSAIIITELLRSVMRSETPWTAARHRYVAAGIWLLVLAVNTAAVAWIRRSSTGQ